MLYQMSLWGGCCWPPIPTPTPLSQSNFTSDQSLWILWVNAEQCETTKIAAEGILTYLQDIICSLEGKKGNVHIENWLSLLLVSKQLLWNLLSMRKLVQVKLPLHMDFNFVYRHFFKFFQKKTVFETTLLFNYSIEFPYRVNFFSDV